MRSDVLNVSNTTLTGVHGLQGYLSGDSKCLLLGQNSFLLSLSHDTRPGVGRAGGLKLALELNQLNLSPKELINAPLKEDL